MFARPLLAASVAAPADLADRMFPGCTLVNKCVCCLATCAGA